MRLEASIKAEVSAEAIKAPDWVFRWITTGEVDLIIIGFLIRFKLI